LICGGRMSILAEPLALSTVDGRGQGIADYCRLLRRLVDGGLGCTEAVVTTGTLGLPVGTRWLFDADGNLAGSSPRGGAVPAAVTGHLVPVRKRPRPALHQGVAFLPILPRITLLIVGGGHVGQAVAHLAASVDFDIWILDDRENYVSAERFPTAQRRMVGDIGAKLQQLSAADIQAGTYAIIVTRGHGHDEEALYHLASSKAGYVGMIGSKRKIKLIYEDLLARGLAPAALERVHAPLGTAIGSQTVPEIAISIVGELIAYRNLGSASAGAK
jgi:xanthine dehydrogenase accessory factor